MPQASFPISIPYAQSLPSGRSGNVRMSTQYNAGGAELAQDLVGLGGKIAKTEEKIRTAQDASELSTIDRKIHENWNATYSTMQTTQDENARAKLYQAFVADSEKIAGSASKRVQGKAQIGLNAGMPQFQAYYGNLDRTMKINKLQSEFEYNGTAALAQGNLPAYYGILNNMEAVGILDSVKHEAMVKSAPIDSAMAQSLIMIDDTNPDTMEQSLLKATETLINLKDLTVKQTEERFKLLSWAERKNGQINKTNGDIAEKQLSEFSKKMLDHTITRQEIEDSKLGTVQNYEDKDKNAVSAKEIFGNYAEASNQSPPKYTQPEGSRVAAKTVLEFSEKGLTKEEAYIKLNDERFIKRTINDNLYIWAVNRIEKPYDRNVAMPLRSILEYNKTSKHGLIETKEDMMEAQQVDLAVLDYVDKKIEAGQEVDGGDIAQINGEYWQSIRDSKKPKVNYTPYNINSTQMKFLLNSMGLVEQPIERESASDIILKMSAAGM